MLSISRTLDTSHPLMSPSKEAALRNIYFISRTLDTFQRLRSPLNERAPSNMYDISRTLDTSQRLTAPLKSCASRNIFAIVRTLDTSHRFKSQLNESAPQNMHDISRTLDTSHVSMPEKSLLMNSPSTLKQGAVIPVWKRFFISVIRPTSIFPKETFSSIISSSSSLLVAG